MSPQARFVLSLILAAGVAGGGTALERVAGHPEPQTAASTQAAPTASSGAWFCPHGGGEDWRTWITVANPGERPASLSITTLSTGKPQRQRGEVPAASQRAFRVISKELSSATLVESFGAPAAVTAVTELPDGGLASEPCTSQAGERWFVPDGSTLRGRSSRLVIANPFAEDAVVDVALLSRGEVVKAGRLLGVVIKPYRVAAFNLNEFALGKDPLVALVQASLGRVAVGGLVVGEGTARSALAVPGPARRWVLPGGGDSTAAGLVIATAGDRRVPFRAWAQGPDGQVVLIDDGTVAGGSAETFDIEARGAGVVAEADGPAPFVAGRRLVGAGLAPAAPPPPKGKGGKRGREPPQPAAPPVDTATTAGAPAASPDWVCPSPLPPAGGEALLLLENPGAEDATASIVLLGASGAQHPEQLSEVSVPAGRSIVVDLSETAGPEPVAAAVSASAPIVAAQVGRAQTGFALALGVPR
jgi:hypothetical protein